MSVRTRAVVVLALLAALLGLGAGQAGAAGEIGLSRDGVHFTSALSGPLFEPGFVWVPGDSQSAAFYVRNQAPEDAVLDVTMQTGPVESLIETGDLTVGARVDSGAYSDATTAGDHLLVDQVPVAAGATRRIEVRVTFDPSSSNASQLTALDLRFAVRLSQDASVLPPGGTGGHHGHGTGSGIPGLPGTGSEIEPWMVVLAAVLLATGLLLVGRSRRRGEEAQP